LPPRPFPYTTLFRSPTNQEIDFRIDNYCYVPQYIFSGIVFDDNGGIASSSASKDNADITTPTSPYTNNSDYFNGVFDTSSETGRSEEHTSELQSRFD